MFISKYEKETLQKKVEDLSLLVAITSDRAHKSEEKIVELSLKLLRNSTDLSTFEKQTLYTGTTVEINGTTSTFYLDSPATTSSTTYKTQYKNVVANGTVSINPGSSVSTMTLMEIAA